MAASQFWLSSALSLARSQGAPQQGTQAPPAEKPVMSEEYFKNIQILRGIPVDEFMDTMGMFSAATGMNCVDCHVSDAGGNWAKYADDTDYKQRTRMMIVMVNALNQSSFGGRSKVTCFTCHRGLKSPAVIPSLDLQYGDPAPVDPDEITQAVPGRLSRSDFGQVPPGARRRAALGCGDQYRRQRNVPRVR